jgi:hypothetical protein
MNRFCTNPSFRRPIQLAAAFALLIAAILTFASASARAQTLALPACPQSVVAGQIVWSSSCAVSTSLSIPSAATLVIQPGVVASFAPGTGLTILGSLDARGTQARQVVLTASTAGGWLGVTVVPTAGDVHLQSVTIANAAAGLLVPSTTVGVAAQPGRIDVLDSLFQLNTIGIDVDYTVDTGQRLTLRNNLFTKNGVGLEMTGVPNRNVRPKLNHNSFTGNGIGVHVLNATGQGLRARQQWWGSPDGPLNNTTACANPPLPGTATRDLVCGAITVFPWSKAPSGRVLLASGQGITLESGLGVGAMNDDDLAATSVLTLTVPGGTFTQGVDLLASPRNSPSDPPGHPTELDFEITAAANGQEIHTFAPGHQLTLDISYLASDLSGADPQHLVLYYLDEATGAWAVADAHPTIDTLNRRVVFHLSHLSRYRITSAELQETFLPLVLR